MVTNNTCSLLSKKGTNGANQIKYWGENTLKMEINMAVRTNESLILFHNYYVNTPRLLVYPAKDVVTTSGSPV